MLRTIVADYAVQVPLATGGLVANGSSASPKGMIFHILPDNAGPVEVLDIGFGTGSLGQMIKSHPPTAHWQVDGIEGWEANCSNQALFAERIYRNVWHGLAQELSADRLRAYRIVCLLDVIEHLTADTARWLLRTLLAGLSEDAFLFVSTPLWFYPQDQQQAGDLEEHLIGIPASSMMALQPRMYAVNPPLIGGFVLDRRSLDFIEFFQPTADRRFSYERGLKVVQAVGMRHEPNTVFRLP